MFMNSLKIGENNYYFWDLKKIFMDYPALKKSPNSLKILLESNIRNSSENKHKAIIEVFNSRNNFKTIKFFPNRVVMEDGLGTSSLVELISLRNKLEKELNPSIPFDLILNHEDNKQKATEEYSLVKWSLNNLKNFSVIPPNSDNNKQVNMEYLSTLINYKSVDGKPLLFPEAVVGTDFYTTKINALGVLGIKVNSLKAKSCLYGSYVSFDFPEVVGINISGSLAQGVSILDAILALSSLLENRDLDGKIIEFYGEGLKNISIEDRAVLSDKVTSFGAMCGYFAIDEKTISFIEKTRGIDASFFKEYYERQGLFTNSEDLEYDERIDLDLSSLKAVVLGPKRLQDRTYIDEIKLNSYQKGNFVKDNDIVLAYINTNCSNLSLLIQAALLAKNAIRLGLQINKNIKRVFILGSKSIARYLDELDLLDSFAKLGFYFTTNEEEYELIERVVLDIEKFSLNVCSVNYNFNHIENSHLLTKSNWFMSPALVLAYCLKGTINCDITKESIFNDIYLKDIWPSISEVNENLDKISANSYASTYKDIFVGDEYWNALSIQEDTSYEFKEELTYVQPFEHKVEDEINKIDINNARVLAIFDGTVKMDELTALGKIPPYSPASVYLQEKGLKPDEFYSFETRICNSELLKRGCLSNINLKNKIVSPKEGGYTKDFQTGELVSIFDLASKLKAQDCDTVIFAKDEFASGKFYEWSIKGLHQIGIKAIIANSYHEEYRKALIEVGILPLEFIDEDINSLHLKGNELITINKESILSEAKIELQIKRDSQIKNIEVKSRLDNNDEVLYYKNGGVINYLVKNIK